MILPITGVCFVRDGLLLTVRKRGTGRFMLVGGKIEAGEQPVDAAVREIAEEIGVNRTPDQLHLLGHFTEEAANEPGWRVSSTVFVAQPLTGSELSRLEPRREIAEISWRPITDDAAGDLAPLLARHVLPALRREQ
ncbi:MAG: NUDIX domain-containing protein [Flaviflexus sp.]|nr:NUDIX domain-containing protein [Flaviflexus sp.]